MLDGVRVGLVAHVAIGAVRQEQLDEVAAASLGGRDQWGAAECVARVDVGALAHERVDERLRILAGERVHERGRAVAIARIDVGACLDQGTMSPCRGYAMLLDAAIAVVALVVSWPPIDA